MIRDFRTRTGVAEEWTIWRDNIAPQSDDANEYCRDVVSLEVPFLDELFSGSPIDSAK